MKMKCYLIISIVLLAACAQKPIVAKTASVPVPVSAKPSSLDFLEISYQRGRNSYKFQVEKKLEIMFARSYVDQNLVQERKLSEKEYKELKEMAEKIFAEKEPSMKSLCRTPFEMEMSGSEKALKIHGCRSSSVGALVTELLHRADWMMLQED